MSNEEMQTASPRRKSGFTPLCETYSLKASEESCGTDKLTATLNTYLGKIVEDILKHGGDVLKFAGDALLALWKSEDTTEDLTLLINKAIICSIAIQEECDNYMTDVGVLLGVKIALSVGKMQITHVGVAESKHFDLAGSAVDDVNAAEKWAEPGAIILSRVAFKTSDQSLFLFELLDDGLHYRVAGARVEEESSTVTTVHPTGVQLALMSGLVSTGAALVSTPSVAKRIFAPHVGTLLSRYYPQLKLPRIYRKRGQSEQKEQICKITGNLLKSESFHDPDHRTDIYSKLNDQDIEDLRAYVPKPVLSKIDHGQDLEWLSEMRQVSVLFINMVLPIKGNSHSWALQKAFEVIYECTRRLRGNLNKVFSFDKGCTFIVIFGLPGDKHEDDPARALKAGHRILDSLHQIMDITNESIGVTTGRAFCGVVGHRDRHEYTVIGRKVNMAARLMVNYPGVLSCDDDTYKSGKSKLKKEDFVILPFVKLKGIAEPGTVREYNKHHDREVEEEEYEYPILGRGKEIDDMRELLHAIKCDDTRKSGNRRVVVIEGEGGIGKTRVLEALMDTAEDEDFKVDYVEADMAHAHTPYYVVQTLITNLLELDTCRTASEKEHALIEHITDHKLREKMFLLNDLLGTHIPPNPDFAHMDSDQITGHFHTLLFDIVHQFAVNRPCLFTVDNAQFIDQESWDFLEDLSADSHAILVLSLRPFSSSNPPCEAAIRLIGHETTKKIKLGGLPAEYMSDLACQFMDVMYIPKELEEIIRKKSHGIASWCEQLIKDTITSNVIQIVNESQAFPDKEPASDILPFNSSATNTVLQKRHELADLSRPQTPFYGQVRDEGLLRVSSPEPRRKSLSVFQDSRDTPMASRKERRRSTGTTKSFQFNLASSPYESKMTINDPDLESNKSSRRSSLVPEEETIQESPKFNLDQANFVHASENSMPLDTKKVCIISPGVDISKVVVPESVKDMVLARVDRMMPLEQVTLKCASILGSEFHRSVLQAILPKSSRSSFNLVLYNLAKESILECASLALQHQNAHNHHGFYDFNDPTHAHHHAHHHHHHHHHNVASSIHAQVYCGCYADEMTKVINLSRLMTPSGPKKHCLYLKFVNSYVQETTYSLWLEDQRKELHEKAAMFLESQAHKCKACGGGGFVANAGEDQEERGGQAKVSGTSGRSQAAFSSKMAKRRKTVEMREKVQSQGAFSARAHERTAEIAGTTSALKKRERRKQSPVVNQRTVQAEKAGVGSAFANTSGFFSNAVVGQAVDDRRSSWLKRLRFGRKSVNPEEEAFEQKEGVTGKTLRKFSLIRNSTEIEGRPITPAIAEEEEQEFDDDIDLEELDEAQQTVIDLSNCQCAEVLASVFPQLVDHWRASGNKLKTLRYLTESGAAALATSSNMQALSYLYEVQSMIEQTKRDEQPLATKEEAARVESLIGQALFHMNRLHEALTHLTAALRILGKKQPTSDCGCYVKILKEALRHYLHVFLPGYYIGGAGDDSARLIEQSRCLSHLSHVYHSLHQNNRSLMAALQELNAAEEAEENLHELISAYAGVIECSHLVGWKGWGKTYEEIGKNRCEDPSLYKDPEDMITVAHLYCVSLAFRLAIGGVSLAISSGRHALAIAKQVHDQHMMTTCIPLLAQSLLFTAKIPDCIEVLKELNTAALESCDSHGRALYICCCFDLILEAGWQLEEVNKIMQFTAKMSTDPAFSSDVVPKFYLNASLALWYARKQDWENADVFSATATALEPSKLEVFMSVHGFAKIVEFWLLKLHEDGKNKQYEHQVHKALKKLKDALYHHPLFEARRLLFLSYHNLLRGKKDECKAKLRKCCSKSKDMGLWLDVEWANKNMKEWFSDLRESGSVYQGTTMFALPKPTRT
ncbi:adenylate cyclase type 10-like isoform X2 [Oculina patagonica]